MRPLTDITDSFSWDSVTTIKEICAPLFRNTAVSYFDFARVFTDNRMLLFFTDGHYVNYFLNHDIYKSTPPPICYPGLHLWQSYIDSSYLSEASHNFQYDHGITVIKKQTKYTDIFNFASDPTNKQILHIYLNSFNTLEMFISYFLKKIQPIIKNIGKDSYISLENNFEKKTEILIPENAFANIFQQNEFHLQINGEYIAISKRESQCLALLSQGKTAKEIAKKLDISHRTVETYCDKMREKTHSNTRMELLGKIENKLALKELILNEIM